MLKTGVQKLLAEANAQVKALSVEDTLSLLENPDVVIVDVRDESERRTNGFIPGSVHASRGMLEFYVDPESPVHKDVFSSGKQLVLHCGSGGRSVLAAKMVQDMGVENVSHMAGGFAAWAQAGAPIDRES